MIKTILKNSRIFFNYQVYNFWFKVNNYYMYTIQKTCIIFQTKNTLNALNKPNKFSMIRDLFFNLLKSRNTYIH